MAIPGDPRNQYRPPIPGEGDQRTYRGTGQDRESQLNFSDAQLEAIRNLLMREGVDFNDSQFGDPNPDYYQPEDLEAAIASMQPAWQPDPWSMTQPGQAGGRGPAGLGNAESEQFGPTGSLMDLLAGFQGAGQPGAGPQAPRGPIQGPLMPTRRPV